METIHDTTLAQSPKSEAGYINNVTINATPEQMHRYFDFLASEVQNHPGFYIRFGRHVLKLTFPTQEYADLYASSLQLVKTQPTDHPDGSIHLWTGSLADYLPIKESIQTGFHWAYEGEAGILLGWRYNGQLNAYDNRTHSQYILIKNRPEENTPLWHPFRFEFHNFARRNGYQFLHSAAVGIGDQGVLFSATGGSGKSTTVLGSLLDGLSYVSDDYIIWDPDSGQAYPLYSCGILNTDSLDRLPELKKYVTGWVPNREHRAILDLKPYSDQFVFGMKIRAIIRPSIPPADSSADPEPGIIPDPMKSGKMQLAISTARQNGHDLLKKDPAFLNEIMDAVKDLPSFEFRLSRDRATNAAILQNFIQNL